MRLIQNKKYLKQKILFKMIKTKKIITESNKIKKLMIKSNVNQIKTINQMRYKT